MTDQTPFWVQCIELGGNYNGCISEIRVWRGNDPRPTVFGGDAYVQWSLGCNHSPYRNYYQGFCWAQALHDGLIGPHATILHSGNDRFAVLPHHEDYAHVARMWDLVNAGVTVPNGFIDCEGNIRNV